MTSSIVLGGIFVLIAAVEISAAYQLRASTLRAGSGLIIGAVVTLSLGVLFLIQHAKPGTGLIIVVVAQLVAVVTLVKLIRDRAEREDDDPPRQAAPYRTQQPGTYGGGHSSTPPSPPPPLAGPYRPPQR